jgi:N-acetylneuraminate synthase/N,N'-diacetyllegionaminate synthase
MKTVRIGGNIVGDGYPCFIIAEAGVNHNGDVSLAKKLIDAAVDAGADAVKFQTYATEDIVTRSAEKATYQKRTTGKQETQYEMLKKLELRSEDFNELSTYANKKGIIFLSTPFDEGSVDLLAKLGVPAFKIPSGEITNFPLLRKIARGKKPVILSTGMSVIKEIKEAVNIFQKEGTGEIVLLHCISSYPALAEDTNLRVMATFKRTFNLPVGLSDHTTGIYVPLAAAALGACIIEKHFTLDKSLPGPDHRASLEPGELKEMMTAIRTMEKAMGDGVRRLTAEEKAIRKAARRSLVARVDIPAGTVIKNDMIAIKRPGTGLAPKFLDDVIGKKAVKKFISGEIITRAGIIWK